MFQNISGCTPVQYFQHREQLCSDQILQDVGQNRQKKIYIFSSTFYGQVCAPSALYSRVLPVPAPQHEQQVATTKTTCCCLFVCLFASLCLFAKSSHRPVPALQDKSCSLLQPDHRDKYHQVCHQNMLITRYKTLKIL